MTALIAALDRALRTGAEGVQNQTQPETARLDSDDNARRENGGPGTSASNHSRKSPGPTPNLPVTTIRASEESRSETQTTAPIASNSESRPTPRTMRAPPLPHLPEAAARRPPPDALGYRRDKAWRPAKAPELRLAQVPAPASVSRRRWLIGLASCILLIGTTIVAFSIARNNNSGQPSPPAESGYQQLLKYTPQGSKCDQSNFAPSNFQGSNGGLIATLAEGSCEPDTSDYVDKSKYEGFRVNYRLWPSSDDAAAFVRYGKAQGDCTHLPPPGKSYFQPIIYKGRAGVVSCHLDGTTNFVHYEWARADRPISVLNLLELRFNTGIGAFEVSVYSSLASHALDSFAASP